ncbi:MAG TPA: alpha/beta hydrolase [Microbacteriaceae bacterium]|jgi:pimeloyl-ACP methyl ester carboxylesterase|nr:alpha/beta hydrolase [Microbacteriaceae bacterium]HQX36054.1 alpha/beta hydrolase [Microbacteriaceae bacterium]HQZ47995.1 alpha/beta hydrolase [Microbacteriaceae bacterium]HRA08178.1 alpha/beta hydrolase [Microbacteriaceae bacterium]
MTLFPGIGTRAVKTERLTVSILERTADNAAAPDSRTVVFVHGNLSSSVFWQEAMLALPHDVRAIALDLRGFGSSEALPVDATRGLADFSDDLRATLSALELRSAHLVGAAMGGGVILQHALDYGALSLTLVSPISPFGFGGTRRDGELLTDDAAGTGGGTANPDFVARLKAGDATDEHEASPRTVFRGAYVSPSYSTAHEDEWVAAMLRTSTAAGNYPGDSVESAHWPGFAPGTTGVLNAMSPLFHNVSGIIDLPILPPVLWVHGTADAIVSDASYFDVSYLGQQGLFPGWPGERDAPAQLMVTQTRDVLSDYAAYGGSVTEVTFDGVGHDVHLERPAELATAIADVIRREPTASTPRQHPNPPTEAFIIPSSD